MPGDLVLIVEDNERNMRLARDVLRFHGFQTLEAKSGRDGVELAARHQPAVILMDIQLPDMDGTAALEALRLQPETATTPVVAMTAFAMREERERLLKSGFDGYISKPLDIKHFPHIVRAYCEGTAAEPEESQWRPGSS